MTGPSSRAEPDPSAADTGAMFAVYLEYLRETAITKVLALSDEQQRTSYVPTGWTALELLHHLLHMERRWFLWGFLAEPVDRPWGDSDPVMGETWRVPKEVDAAAVAARLRAVGGRTNEVLGSHDLAEPAAVGGRFTQDPPTLRWICFHVLQEYARHTGHLDIVAEICQAHLGE